MSAFVDILGLAGALVLLYSYAMVSTRRMKGDSLTYQLLNFGGAVALMINSAVHSAWPSAVLNLVWTAIGSLAVWRLLTARPVKRDAASQSCPGRR